MDDLFIIFVAGAALAGWLAGYWWNKHEAASQCAALERELNERHELALRTADAATTAAETRAKVAENKLQSIDEARAARALPPHVATAVEICDRYPKEANARILADYVRGTAA